MSVPNFSFLVCLVVASLVKLAMLAGLARLAGLCYVSEV